MVRLPQRTQYSRYLAPVLQRRHTSTMPLDAPTVIDGLSQGFFMGFLASLLICSLSFGFWLVTRPNSVSQQEVKSRAASA